MKDLVSDAGNLMLAFVTLGICTAAAIGYAYSKVKKPKLKVVEKDDVQ